MNRVAQKLFGFPCDYFFLPRSCFRKVCQKVEREDENDSFWEAAQARVGLAAPPRLVIRPGPGFEDKPAGRPVGTQPLGLLLEAPGTPQTFLRRARTRPLADDFDLC